MMGGVCLSVHLSVACLNLKLVRWKPITQVKYEPIYRSKVKVTKPINALIDNAAYTGRGITIFLKLACLLYHRTLQDAR